MNNPGKPLTDIMGLECNPSHTYQSYQPRPTAAPPEPDTGGCSIVAQNINQVKFFSLLHVGISCLTVFLTADLNINIIMKLFQSTGIHTDEETAFAKRAANDSSLAFDLERTFHMVNGHVIKFPIVIYFQIDSFISIFSYLFLIHSSS